MEYNHLVLHTLRTLHGDRGQMYYGAFRATKYEVVFVLCCG